MAWGFSAPAPLMIVDFLLDLLLQQGADALVLRGGAVPTLSKEGGSIPLSMPPLDADLLLQIAEELSTEGHQRSYDLQGTTFAVDVAGTAEAPQVTFRVEGSGDAPEPDVAEPPVVPRPAVVPAETRPSTRVAVGGSLSPALARVFERALIDNASDVFVSADQDCRLRLGGEIVALPGTCVSADDLMAALAPYWSEARAAVLAADGSADLAFEHNSDGVVHRYRVNVFRQEGGVAAAFRPIRRDVPTLTQLGLPEDFHELLAYRNGLVLMTGMAGSGKSTTLLALVDHLNRTAAKHVLSLEDPIEFRFTSARGLIHQRELGTHVRSFDVGLRAALREAPDIILVGEMRDRETIAAALTAAETGHLVVSTLHCSDVASAVERMIDVFPEHQQAQVRYQLAGSLRAVVGQILLPSTKPPTRVVAYEKLLVNTAVAAKIRDQRSFQLRSELHTGQREGMVPLEATLGALLRQRRISPSVARAAAPDPSLLPR